MTSIQTYWGHTYLPKLIRPDGVVFDFGVNTGGFTRLVAPLCRKVLGFEPDPTYHGAPLPPNATLVPNALSAAGGTVVLHVNKEKCSSLHYADAESQKVEVQAMTLAEALALEPDARIDMVKIDIEGEEVSVLALAPEALFQRVVQISVEFHDFMDPQSLPHVLSVIERMKSFGFVYFKFSWRSYGDVLFVNRKLAPVSALQVAGIRLGKYERGIGRILARALKP